MASKIKYGKGKGETRKSMKRERDGEKYLASMKAPSLKGKL